MCHSPNWLGWPALPTEPMILTSICVGPPAKSCLNVTTPSVIAAGAYFKKLAVATMGY